MHHNESSQLRVVRAKSVLTCLASLHSHMPTCLAYLRAQMPTCKLLLHTHVLTYQDALHAYAYMLMCQRALCDYVLTFQRVSFNATFSVSLSLILKLYTLLVRFKSWITAFPQWHELTYKPSLLIIWRIAKRLMDEMLNNSWDVLVS